MSSAPPNLLPILQADKQSADQSVAGPSGPGYCSYVDVQSILNVSITNSSVPNLGTVNDLIVRASSYVDQVSSHTWTIQQVTEYYDAIGSGPRAGTIILRHRPLLTVQEVAWWYGGILAWMPGFYGFPQETVSVQQGPSTTLDQFQTTVPADNLQQPQSYLVYFPEGKIQWNTMRLDDRLRYRVIYTYGYSVPPDFVRDLTSVIVAIDVLTFWGSQLGIAEDNAMMKKRLEEKKFRLEARASQRPAAAVG
jgi:hypothetical protein